MHEAGYCRQPVARPAQRQACRAGGACRVGAFVAANAPAQLAWLQVGMPKIVVHATDADALVQLEARARAEQIPACLVHDAGRTVLPAGTITCLGLGPAPAEIVDQLTGGLPLV